MTEIQGMLATNPGRFELATTADEVGCIAIADMLGIAHFINNDLATRRPILRVRDGTGSSAKEHELVAAANRLGIVLDASYASDDVLDQLLDLSTAPIVLSHSAAKVIYDHLRKVDAVI